MAIVVENKLGTPQGILAWTKYTLDYTDFSTAANSINVELFQLPAGRIIHATRVKHSVAFTGGSINGYVVSIGISGDLFKYTDAATFTVFSAPSDISFKVSTTTDSESFNATPVSIRVRAASTGDTLDAATQGSCDFWVLTSQPPA